MAGTNPDEIGSQARMIFDDLSDDETNLVPEDAIPPEYGALVRTVKKDSAWRGGWERTY